jgi:nicotinate-nucleotide adenylyltransferase
MIRCAMIQRALEGKSEFFLSPVELELEAPYYTYKTLELLQKQYPNDEFSLIVGSDVALSIKDWENGGWILQNFPLITVNRPGCDEPGIVDIPLEINTSSTLIRAKVKKGESIADLVPPGVDEIIECIKLYKNE